MRQTRSILIVGSDIVDRLGINRTVSRSEMGLDIEEAASADEARSALYDREYDCALVCFDLVDGDAFDLLSTKAPRTRLARTPIIVLLRDEDPELADQLLTRGALDYLLLSELDHRVVARAIRNAIRRHSIQRELDLARSRLQELSNRDPLTGLLNRRGITPVLIEELIRGRRSGTAPLALLIDCDDFKAVNDIHGHGVGDQVLSRIAKSIVQSLRTTDAVARIGGDEFMVLLPNTRVAEGLAVGERICTTVRENPVQLEASDVRVTVSVGAARIPEDAKTPGDIASAARLALRRVKLGGKDRVVWADPSRNSSFGKPSLSGLIKKLRAGLELHSVFQPIVHLTDGRVCGYEALTRGPKGATKPEQLFALSREYDAQTDVDLQCLKRCVEASGSLPEHEVLYVNIRPSTLLETPIDRIAELCHLRPWRGRLSIDLSNQWLMGDPAKLSAVTNQLRHAEIEVGLDQVGFGRSSLEALLVLAPSVIKTDPRLVIGLASDHAKARVMERLVNVAASLGSRLVAVGLEDDADVIAARDLGVQYGQGFTIGNPVESATTPPTS